MANHKLSLEIPPTLNKCILRVIDSSVYNSDITLKCGRLQIMAPGFSTSEFIDDVYPNFSVNLTACDLKIQKVNCGTDFNSLPDGIYVIKWSVSPNEIVYVEYNHLRTTNALDKLSKIYCDLDLACCEPSAEMKRKLDQLTEIQQYLTAAKIKVEYCREAKKGMELFKQALKMLDKMNCKNCN